MKHFTRKVAVILFCLAGMRAQSPTACSNCPVNSVNPTATVPFAHADTSHGCTTKTKIGLPVPDPKCTPGAINPTVTLAVLKNRAFTTSCLRDCVTQSTEKNTTYGFYGLPHPTNNQGPTQTCELDHLVSLELGGADSLDNIWPQCGPNHVVLAQRYFKQKDAVENFLAAHVRSGMLDLATVQKGIASDWTQYIGQAKTFCKNNPNTCRAAHK